MNMEKNPEIARLQDGGWPIEGPRGIAAAIGASVRTVYRWSRGEVQPLPIYVRALQQLPSLPLPDTVAA